MYLPAGAAWLKQRGAWKPNWTNLVDQYIASDVPSGCFGRREYSKDYIPTEEAAQRAHRGIWDGTFQYPADWRKAEKAKGSNSAEVQGLPRAIPPPDIAVPYIPPPSPPQAQGSPTAAAQPGSCGPTAPIKGNISAKGERIYHLPGRFVPHNCKQAHVCCMM